MKYKCLIVDDEPLACEIIESYLNRFSDFEIVAIVHNAIEAFQVLKNKKINLVFLDIQMPKITGMNFLKTLKKRPEIIITTAYRNYAVESFELEVLDYLLKPISFDRFMASINRFYKQKSLGLNLSENISTVEEIPKYFYVKENKRMVKIEFSKLYYIESIKDYIKLYTHEKTIVTKIPIGNLESKLPQTMFLRVHRSFIVNTEKIEAFTGFNILIKGIDIPIGRSYKNSVAAVLNPKGLN